MATKKKKKRTRTTRKPLSGDVLGISPYQTDRGSGIRVAYKARTLVRTATSAKIEEEVIFGSVDCCDDDAARDPELRLAIRTLAGVSDSYAIVVNHFFIKRLEPGRW